MTEKDFVSLVDHLLQIHKATAPHPHPFPHPWGPGPYNPYPYNPVNPYPYNPVVAEPTIQAALAAGVPYATVMSLLSSGGVAALQAYLTSIGR